MNQILIANHLVEKEGASHYLVGINDHVLEDLSIIIGQGKTLGLIKMIKETNDDLKLFVRYHQFVVFVRHQPTLGFSMELIEFNNVDSALDDYLSRTGNEWDKQDRDKIMDIYSDIQNNPLNRAEIQIIPLPKQ